jgi:hypothetical protein
MNWIPIYDIVERFHSSPCGDGLEYLHRSPCESWEVTKKEHSLRWDGNVWLLVLSDLTSQRFYCKLQTRPLVREGSLQEEQQSNCHQRKDKDKIWSWASKGIPISRRTGRLTVGRQINSNSTVYLLCPPPSRLRTYGSMEVRLRVFLPLALYIGTGFVYGLGPFTLIERDPCTHWLENWVGPRRDLEAVTKR